MISVLSSILTAVVNWVTTAFGVITSNDFLLAFVVLGVVSMVVGLALTMVRGLRK